MRQEYYRLFTYINIFAVNAETVINQVSDAELREYLENCYTNYIETGQTSCQVCFLRATNYLINFKLCDPDEPKHCNDKGVCLPAAELYFAGNSHIGITALFSQINVCRCFTGYYGLNCDSQDANSIGSDCGDFGSIDPKNTVTGCACKISDVVTEYHGWYCDVPNALICSDEEFYVHEVTTIVGDQNNCKDCNDATFINCAKCEQKDANGNNFEIYVEKQFSQEKLLVFNVKMVNTTSRGNVKMNVM